MKEKPLSKPKSWGRASYASFTTLLLTLSLFIFTPLFVLFFYISAFYFDGSLLKPLQLIASGNFNLINYLPPATLGSIALFATWFFIQLLLSRVPDVLHRIIPNFRGGDVYGAITPAGHKLLYRINGLQAWIISHIFFILGAFVLNWFSPTIIFDNWGPLLWVTNGVGFTLAIFAYIKAYVAPSHPEDRKFSGSALYDFFMGIELNPRIGTFDFKLFFNGRPGIIAWTLINLSFAAAQYKMHGTFTNSMILVNFLQALYVLYFFWKESWYLKTIDIHHDHFGWMLAWGDSVWLPYMYTLQALYLVFNPIELSTGYALFVLAFGLLGFYIFADANNQKDRFRESEGKTLIWGKKPEVLACEYRTKEGEVRKTNLLTSGWWGVTRHMNYTGDLILSLAYSLACGFTGIFPYFYFVFLSILLIHRCLRDEKRCQDKYGLAWTTYCKEIPYRLIPKVW